MSLNIVVAVVFFLIVIGFGTMPIAFMMKRPRLAYAMLACALLGFGGFVGLAMYAESKAAPQVATASQLNCEEELHRMFETREQCRQLKDLEDRFGHELAGGVK